METYWGEEMESPKQDHEAVKLTLCGDVEKKMDDRFILLDEVKQAVLHAERSGDRFVDRENGYRIAHLKIGHVTYWVEYERCGDGYKVHKAYSHRIQIVEEGDSRGPQ